MSAMTVGTADLFSEIDAKPSGARWYAVYTWTRHEKKVSQELCRRAVENYLPTYFAWHRWTDRRMKVEVPLFPSYAFVRIRVHERLQVLTIPGVVRLVGNGSGPSPLADVEVEGIRKYLSNDGRVEPYDGLVRGSRVRVRSGPLNGCEGVLLRHKGALRLIVTLELIARSIMVEVSAHDVELLRPAMLLPRTPSPELVRPPIVAPR